MKVWSSPGVQTKKQLFTVLVGIFLAVWLAGAGIMILLSPAGYPPGETREVTISPSSSSAVIGRLLQEQGLVHSAWFFKYYARMLGVDGRLKAGHYQFTTAQSLPQIVHQLLRGTGTDEGLVFTIPEGFTLVQTADLLQRRGLVSRDAFLASATKDCFDYPFLRDVPAGPNRLEGYLFPDTYRVGNGASAHEILDLMLSRFDRKLKEMDYARRAKEAGLTLRQAVIIASMIEREARVDEERTIISGVIRNRLERGMPLQVDATVQYALGSQRAKLYYKDLEVDSPYNTYRVNGLPPGPISSPGEASLLAAVQPAKTPFLYYVARPDGTHAFATNLEEHNANKHKYLR